MSMLSRMHQAQEVFLCLDNDAAGQAASLRMAEQIAEQFGIASDRLTPKTKTGMMTCVFWRTHRSLSGNGVTQ